MLATTFRFKITHAFVLICIENQTAILKVALLLLCHVALLFICELRCYETLVNGLESRALEKKKTIRIVYSGGSENIPQEGTRNVTYIKFIKAASQ